jgi:hypothetical protein
MEKLKEKYWKQFLREDHLIKQGQLSGAAKQYLEMKEGWKAYRAQKDIEHARDKPFRRDDLCATASTRTRGGGEW